MGYGLGVDLGTTHTAAAVDAGRVEAVQLGSRRAEIPSMVYLHPDGTMLVGEAAERRGDADPARLARECKRRIGDPVPILLGGTPFSAHALTARLLHHVVTTVTRERGAAPDRIVITHPANWGPYKRELLTQAARQADLPDVTLRPEPEAAAVRFASTARVAEGANIAVYDLGGGTFDAVILRKSAGGSRGPGGFGGASGSGAVGGGFTVLGEPVGIEQLGGIDFDEAIVEHVRATLGDALASLEPDDDVARAAMARLRRDCIEAKEALSFDTEAVIAVALPRLHTRVRINRDEFEAMIRPALDDTVVALQRALRSAGLEPADLHAIVLAGGSSRIPLVGEMLMSTFDRPVVLDEQPELGIAMGAALLSRGREFGALPLPRIGHPAMPPPPPPAAAWTFGPAPASSASGPAPASFASGPAPASSASGPAPASSASGPAPASSAPASSAPASSAPASSGPVSSGPVSFASAPASAAPPFFAPAPAVPPAGPENGPVPALRPPFGPVRPPTARARAAVNPPTPTPVPARPARSDPESSATPGKGFLARFAAWSGGPAAEGRQRWARLRTYRWPLIGGGIATALVVTAATAWPRSDDEPGAAPAAVVSQSPPAVTAALWTARTGRPATGPVAVAAQHVVVGGSDGALRGLRRGDGRQAWVLETGEAVFLAPQAPGGIVYATTADGELLAVNAATGDVEWRRETAARFVARPQVAGPRVAAGGRDSVLYAYEIAGSHRRWRVWADAEIRLPPVTAGEMTVVAGADGRLYGADAYGGLIWKRPVGPVNRPLAAAGDAVCAALAAGGMTCVRATDGRRPVQIGAARETPAGGNGLVFAATADRTIGAWDPGTGALRWRHQLAAASGPGAGDRPSAAVPAPGSEDRPSEPGDPPPAAHLLVHGAQLVVAHPDGRLLGLDAATGRELWRHTVPDTVDTAPAGDGRNLFVVGRTGTVYALTVPYTAGPRTTPPPAPSSRPGPATTQPEAEPTRTRKRRTQETPRTRPTTASTAPTTEPTTASPRPPTTVPTTLIIAPSP